MTLTPPVMQRWADFPLGAALEDAVGLPVLLDNDATAAAIGEYWSGGIATGSAFAALYMGTGIGAGIIVDGTVYRGSSSNAGEVGHICVDLDGPECWCGNLGLRRGARRPGGGRRRRPGRGLELAGRERRGELRLARACRQPRRGRSRCSSCSGRRATSGSPRRRWPTSSTSSSSSSPGRRSRSPGRCTCPRSSVGWRSRSSPAAATRCGWRISSNAPEAAAVGAAALVLQSELAPRQVGVRMPLELPLEVTAG